MDERQQKGMMIAATMRIQRSGDAFIVPSQSLNGRYAVDGAAKTCSCPDFELRQKACKHLHAVEFYLKRETVTDPDGTTTITETAAVRVTYTQNWPAYNAAQTSEKGYFLKLLRDLCDGVKNPPQGNGRPHLPIGDQLFCMAFKVYSGMSTRRFATDLREAHASNLISGAPAYNSVIRYFEDESLTPILHNLITTAAKPLASVEAQFAVDSTGLGTQCFYRHYSAKYGHDQMNRDYLKVHACIGTKTNVVTAVEITDRDANDGPQFPGLVNKTAENFFICEMSADKAYSTVKNLTTVSDLGATPFVPFKANSVGNGDSPLWNKLWHFFQLNKDEFLPHYHRRSNVEATFSMIKRVIGDTLRSKTRTAQINEALLMVLCHNIRCLIHEMHELDIAPSFMG